MDLKEGGIKDIVKKILAELDSKRFIDYKKINLSFKKVLSLEETKYMYIHSFKEGILRIKANSPVLLYQLNLKKNLILEKLQEDFDFIKGISFSLGSLPEKERYK